MRQNFLKTVVVISASVAACSPSEPNTDQTSADPPSQNLASAATTPAGEQIGLNCDITFITTGRNDNADRLTLTVNIDTAAQQWWVSDSVSHERNPRSALFVPNRPYRLHRYADDADVFYLEPEFPPPHFAAQIDRHTGMFTRLAPPYAWSGSCTPGAFTPASERRF